MNPALWVVDWGTSSFRLGLLDSTGNLLWQVASAQGVSKLSARDMPSYLSAQMDEKPDAPRHLPVIVCGMAGSTLGWQETPYVSCPLSPSLLAQHLEPLAGWPAPAWLVPGLACVDALGEPNVMRGEETQLIGWLAQASAQQRENSVICLPGTHAKWVKITDGKIQSFITSITGELYALLAEHSVLVKGGQCECTESFEQGVRLAQSSDNSMFSLFSTRARVLRQLLKPEQAASFLSGLLIGSEISSALKLFGDISNIHLICNRTLAERYVSALACFGKPTSVHGGDALAFNGLFELFCGMTHES